jgi:hypothetical protein
LYDILTCFSVRGFCSASALSSKPPSTAQSPDLTLEDDQLVDFAVNDVSNSLPANLPNRASASAPAAAGAGAADPLGVSVSPAAVGASSTASAAAAAAANPDAMDVDSGSPAASPKAPEADQSTPMDVSEGADEVQQTPVDGATPPAHSAAETEADKKIAAAHETHIPPVPASSPPPPAPVSPTLIAQTLPHSAAATNSPSSASAPSPAAAPIPFSPLSDPTSALRMESYEHIKDTVIPCLQLLILDNNAEVRAAACDALVRVADVLRGDDVGKVVLTLVLNLAHDERDEQRTTAVHVSGEKLRVEACLCSLRLCSFAC